MVDAATAPLRLMHAIVVGGAAGLLMPFLLVTQASAPSAVVLAALAVAVAAVVVLHSHVATFVPSALASVSRAMDDVPSFLAGAVTDPLRHPLRPRAPGLV